MMNQVSSHTHNSLTYLDRLLQKPDLKSPLWKPYWPPDPQKTHAKYKNSGKNNCKQLWLYQFYLLKKGDHLFVVENIYEQKASTDICSIFFHGSLSIAHKFSCHTTLNDGIIIRESHYRYCKCISSARQTQPLYGITNIYAWMVHPDT